MACNHCRWAMWGHLRPSLGHRLRAMYSALHGRWPEGMAWGWPEMAREATAKGHGGHGPAPPVGGPGATWSRPSFQDHGPSLSVTMLYG